MELRGAAFSWGVENESVRECRVRRNEAKGSGGGRLGGIYRGRGVAASLFDWPRCVAAHLIVGVVGRQGLQEKKVRSTMAGRNCHANTMAGSIFFAKHK
jgi:hypothetical protein